MSAVTVPDIPVALSTSSAYPENCAAAFSLAERLGYDAVEVMVWTDPVTQEAGALKTLVEHHGIPVVSIHAPTLLISQRVWGNDPWDKVDRSLALAAEVRTLIPQIRAGQRQKLEARLADVAQNMEPGRLEQELVLWLQKLDVDEELDRLDSHVKEIRRIFTQKEPQGRRLDFLLQEFNREANTLGSKSVDIRTTNIAVELKVLIDQIREQAQNIE